MCVRVCLFHRDDGEKEGGGGVRLGISRLKKKKKNKRGTLKEDFLLLL